METLTQHTISYLQKLLENGIAHWQSKGHIDNEIGATFWNVRNWKSPESAIIFNDAEFEAAVKSIPCILYTFSRLMTDDSGKPVVVDGNRQRSNSGLLLYHQFAENPEAGHMAVQKIISDYPMLNGYVCTLEDLQDYIPQDLIVEVNGRKCLKGVNRWNPITQSEQPVILSAAIFLPVQSGGVGSSQLWSNRRSSDARAMSKAYVAGDANTDELPFS